MFFLGGGEGTLSLIQEIFGFFVIFFNLRKFDIARKEKRLFIESYWRKWLICRKFSAMKYHPFKCAPSELNFPENFLK